MGISVFFVLFSMRFFPVLFSIFCLYDPAPLWFTIWFIFVRALCWFYKAVDVVVAEEEERSKQEQRRPTKAA